MPQETPPRPASLPFRTPHVQKACTIQCQDSTATPLLYRWNFQRYPGSRTLPWAQIGGGLLWTNHKFPDTGDTSVINFTPQLGAGLSAFVRKHQSLDLAVKVVHIYSVSLGDNATGVTSLQFSAGYSWWK